MFHILPSKPSRAGRTGASDLQVEIECLKAYNKELKCLLGQMRNEFNRFKELTLENADLSQRLVQLSA